jgi:hypothetical protein
MIQQGEEGGILLDVKKGRSYAAEYAFWRGKAP